MTDDESKQVQKALGELAASARQIADSLHLLAREISRTAEHLRALTPDKG